MTAAIEQIRCALDRQRLTVNRLDDGTAVLLDIEGEKLMTLNATALRVIDGICDGLDTTDALGHRLTEVYEVEFERAAQDASALVDRLADVLQG
jgi:hypothetical protein